MKSVGVSRLDQCVPSLADIPRVRLGHTPTPLDHAPRLGAALGIELRIKRDDCNGLAFGGNKVRQLEFYLGEARAADADTVVITGAVQSNFVRVAAGAARHLGMDIHIQLEERVAEVDETYRRSGNVLLDRLYGARLHHYPAGEDEAGADRALESIARRLREYGRRPYVVHLGIDHPPVGGLGYVVAAAELLDQLAPGDVVSPHCGADCGADAVVVASGSALTHAGLLVGLRAMGMGLPVYGVCVRRPVAPQAERVLRRAREIAHLLGHDDLLFENDINLTDAVLAPGYGQLNSATLQAIESTARLEGLLLDPVYTGKAMAGLETLVDSGVLATGSRVIFVHTGGQPALFGYGETLARTIRERAV